MPVLKLAPRIQSWLTAPPPDCSDQSPSHVVRIPEAFPAVTRRWTPTAAAVEETGPVSPTLARPSSEVIGGAFVGAFLGLLILIFLIWCCCCGRRRGGKGSSTGSDKSSSTTSPPSSPRAPLPVPPPAAQTRPPFSTRGLGPAATLPVRPAPGLPPSSAHHPNHPRVPLHYHQPVAPPTIPPTTHQAAPTHHPADQQPHHTLYEPSRATRQTRRPAAAFNTTHGGNHALVVPRTGGIPRPPRHDRVELESLPSSLDDHQERVSVPLSNFECEC